MSRMWGALLVSSLVFNQACYNTRVVADAPPASADYSRKTVHSLFWGLSQENVQPPVTQNCVSNAFQEVRVTSNAGYALLTVLTLGFWSPMQVEYKCAKEPPPPPPNFHRPPKPPTPPNTKE